MNRRSHIQIQEYSISQAVLVATRFLLERTVRIARLRPTLQFFPKFNSDETIGNFEYQSTVHNPHYFVRIVISTRLFF